MRILIEIGHPAHVHFFRNAIKIWGRQGHDLLVVSREKEMTNYLLDRYGIDAISISKPGRGMAGLFGEMLLRDYRLWKLTRKFDPDIMTSIGGTWISQIGKLTNKPTVVFYDTENAKVSNAITYPLVAVLCTPKCYQKTTHLGNRHLRYPGYHELAYLHPARFTPDKRIIERIGLRESDRYFVVRFVAWKAGHDVGEKGLADKHKESLIDLLSRYGRVFITSESVLSPQLERYASTVPAEDIHHLMAFSTLVVGESATMASEAAVLGVPAVFISDTSRGYIEEQQRDFGLVFHFTDQQIDDALDKISTLISRPDLRGEWEVKRNKMLKNAIDVTAFVVDLINNYPSSVGCYRSKWSAFQEFLHVCKRSSKR